MRRLVGFLLLVLLTGSASAQSRHPLAMNGSERAEWVRPFEPFRIIGNVYWVGGYDLAVYLITTPAGHILINTGVGNTAREIAASVARLGFRIQDVKILTATHGHIDHAAGLAELKRMTGAQVIVNARDRSIFEDGGASDYVFGPTPVWHFEPVAVDRTFEYGEPIVLGGVRLQTHMAAGHTKGATTFSLDVVEAGRTYRVGIVNLGSINPGVNVAGMPTYPTITSDYAETFRVQKAMALDVFLASHASQFHLHDKYSPGAPYDPERFVDPAGFQAEVEKLEAAYRTALVAGRPR